MADEEETQNEIERCERALVLLAYFIELDGNVYLPLFAKIEEELEALKRAQDTRDRPAKCSPPTSAQAV